MNLENVDEPPDVWQARAGVYRAERGRGVRRIIPDEVRVLTVLAPCRCYLFMIF